MNPLDYLNSLIEGQKVSEIPVQLVELQFLRTLIENQFSTKESK
jgi:hypothetical protein